MNFQYLHFIHCQNTSLSTMKGEKTKTRSSPFLRRTAWTYLGIIQLKECFQVVDEVRVHPFQWFQKRHTWELAIWLFVRCLLVEV